MTETVKEIRATLDNLETQCGPDAETHTAISFYDDPDGEAMARILLWPRGVGKCDHISGIGKTFADAADDCTAQWETVRVPWDTGRIEEMALKIIEATYRGSGACFADGLIFNGFSQEEIDRLGDAAVALATEMAGGAPFCILAGIVSEGGTA